MSGDGLVVQRILRYLGLPTERGSEFRDVVAFAVVMLFMVFKPTGILGEKAVERV